MHVILFGSCDHQYEICPQLSQDKCECNILHEDTRDAHVPGLPSTWPGGAGEQCPTMTLPCGHTFNPTALAVHFLYQHMRCPVCRAGHDGVMRLECVPADVRDVFCKKLRSMRERHDPPVGLLYAVDVADVEQDLLLTVEVSVQPDEFAAIAQTRIYRAGPSIGTSFNAYNTQRSFSRLLGTFLGRHTARSVEFLRVRLTHPLFELPLYSAPTALADLTSAHTFVITQHNECIARLHYTPHQHEYGLHVHTSTIVETCLARIHDPFSMSRQGHVVFLVLRISKLFYCNCKTMLSTH